MDDEIELDEDALGNVTIEDMHSNPAANSSMDLGARVLDSFFYED